MKMRTLLAEFLGSKKQYKLTLVDRGFITSTHCREKKASKYFRVALKNSLDLTLIYSQGFLLTKMNELSSSSTKIF